MSASDRWFSGQADLNAHLIFLATSIRQVSLSMEGDVLQGRVGMPTAQGLLPFHLHVMYGDRASVPGAGARVRLDYEGYGVKYSFRTRVARAAPGEPWMLRFPRTVECSDRRLVHRYRVVDQPGFRLWVRGMWRADRGRAYPLVDMSGEGLGFFFHPMEAPLERGSLLSAELEVPELEVPPVLMRVTNLRPDERHPPGQIAGARFLDFGPAERRAMVLALSLWEQRRLQM